MPSLDQSLIEDLTCHLREKPDLVARRERNESWMTAAEIANWIKDTRGIEHRSEEIEEELLAWWRADPHSRLIRPAKYPAENRLRDFGVTSTELAVYLKASPDLPNRPAHRFGGPLLPPHAPVCFCLMPPQTYILRRAFVFFFHITGLIHGCIPGKLARDKIYLKPFVPRSNVRTASLLSLHPNPLLQHGCGPN